jgi:hypothetical protein
MHDSQPCEIELVGGPLDGQRRSVPAIVMQLHVEGCVYRLEFDAPRTLSRTPEGRIRYVFETRIAR